MAEEDLGPIDDRWREREEAILDLIKRSIKYYGRRAMLARIMFRTIGVIVLIGSIVAPVTVVSSTGSTAGLALFGASERTIAQIAIIVTIVLALSEGLRRLFQFEHRWMSCVQAYEQLSQLRDTYLDAQVAHPRGSQDWVRELNNLRKSVHEVRGQEQLGFFQKVKVASETKA